MYRKTRLGPRTELQGISAVIEHSYWDFPSKTTRTILLLGNKEKRPNIWQKFLKISLYWRLACQTLSKVVLKRSPVEWEDLKPYWQPEEKTTFLKFFAGWLFLSTHLCPTFRIRGTVSETFHSSIWNIRFLQTYVEKIN